MFQQLHKHKENHSFLLLLLLLVLIWAVAVADKQNEQREELNEKEDAIEEKQIEEDLEGQDDK
jgi:cell division protein FtsL